MLECSKNFIRFSVTHNHLEFIDDTCIVTGMFEGSCFFPSTEIINEISQGYISSLLQRNSFGGLLGQSLFLYDAPYFLNKPILLIGCGKKNEFNDDNYRKAVSQTIKFCKEFFISKILLLLSELNIVGYDSYWKVRHTMTLFNRELYVFNKFKSHVNQLKYVLNDVMVYVSNSEESECCNRAINDGVVIAKGVNLARDLGNMPANYCTPEFLSHKVRDLPNNFNNFSVEILDESAIKDVGMQAYLSVGKGSDYPAVMPIIKYQNHPKGLDVDPIVLIGKGLTFDSGGISIKPADKMDEMKYDMCGSAVVYAVMCIAAELNLPLNIIGILAISENMVNGSALRPGDIIHTLSGQTVEVINTDAEGRLVLCDVLTYVARFNPKIVIDVATLTGACVVALGNFFSGLLSNDETLVNDLLFASEKTQDYIWQLPLYKEFEEQLKSSCADMTNVGCRSGGVITAACFLNKFVNNKYSWAHLDIAGTAWYSKGKAKSSTGRPVELLAQFLINKSLKEIY